MVRMFQLRFQQVRSETMSQRMGMNPVLKPDAGQRVRRISRRRPGMFRWWR